MLSRSRRPRLFFCVRPVAAILAATIRPSYFLLTTATIRVIINMTKIVKICWPMQFLGGEVEHRNEANVLQDGDDVPASGNP